MLVLVAQLLVVEVLMRILLNIAQNIGSAIVVRGIDISGSTLNDKLLIDENTVNAADMRSFLGHIDTAIGKMNGYTESDWYRSTFIIW